MCKLFNFEKCLSQDMKSIRLFKSERRDVIQAKRNKIEHNSHSRDEKRTYHEI